MRFLRIVLFMVVLLVPLFMFRHPIESFILTQRVNHQYEVSRSMASVSKFKSYGKVNEFSLDQAKRRFAHDPTLATMMEYAKNLIYNGRLDEGIALLSADHEFNIDSSDKFHLVMPKVLLLEAYFKTSELEHCFKRYSPQVCILPLANASLQHNPAYIERALNTISSIQALEPQFDMTWLTDLANHLVGQQSLEKYYDNVMMGEVSFKPITGVFSSDGLAGGVVIDDFNNDGLMDIVTSSIDGPLRLFLRQPNGEYSDASESSGVASFLGGLNITHVDFNNDGWMDIFVTRGAWLGEAGRIANSLLMNVRGRFYDVTYSAGIYSSYPTQVAAWGDVNNDGCVDVFIGNEAYYSELFMNQCDGTFKNKAEEFGIVHMSFVKGASWGDINNDGWIDLYISSYMQPNRCLINLGKDRGFQDLKNANILDVKESFSTWFFDFNNDGLEDLFLGGFNPKADYLLDSNRDASYFNAGIYLNRGNFEFEFLPQSKHYNSMGANFGDMSGDGFLDYYLGVGAPSLIYLEPNRVMLNRGGKDVMDISFVSGLGHLQKGHGVAFADVDMDGDMDIYLVNGGWVPVDNFPNSFFINQSPEHHWVTFRLVGTKSNRAAIGARIKLTLKTPTGDIRYIYRTVSAGGSFGGSPFQQTIAFSSDELQQVDILWPSGNKLSFNQIEMQAMYQISEDGDIKRL